MHIHPVHENYLVCSFARGLRSGETFDTYDISTLIRGAAIVDVGVPGARSINASIGRGLQVHSNELGIVEIKKNARKTVRGRRTSCSIWRKI